MAQAASPCDELTRYARNLPDSAWAKGDAALAPKLVIDEPRSSDAEAKAVSPLELALTKLAKVREALDADSGRYGLFVDRLAGTDLYAVSDFQGTLHCQASVFVRARAGRSPRVVEGPTQYGEGDVCWTTEATFGRAYGAPVFIIHDFVDSTVSKAAFQIWPWTGISWGPACHFTLKFRADYAVTNRFCGDQSVCKAAGGIAREIAVAYNTARERNADTDAFHFGAAATGEAEGLIQPWLKARESDVETPDFPTFGADSEEARPFSYSGFVLFPLRLEGRWYAAAIGHEGVGWREGEHTLLGIYAADGAKLVPLAGFLVTRSLAGLRSATLNSPKASDR